MKVKELLKRVNVAWSPPSQHPIYLAAGTAAQQLDANFNTSATLDLYSLNLQQSGYDMELTASIPSDYRFHKIIWGSYGNNPAGLIVGGCDSGTINIYSASKMLANETNCLVSSPNKHNGPVRAMDFNPFQANLLATGASESELFIWDIIDTNKPMAPGSKSEPLEDVLYIQWNKQVQHILASMFSQRCVIWDLRKEHITKPVITLSDAKVRWKVVQWHPEVSTQLCLASEDDQSPVIQLWDLRYATSPLKTMQNHHRGVLSIAWSPHDSDLLLSCAKDNRILCWNPNSDAPNGEVICEVAQTHHWNFDVSWSPRNPGLIVGTSFDGHAIVYSLLGGQTEVSTETFDKIVDSFPGMNPFAAQPPPPAQTESVAVLKKAPKWLRRPAGASFAFGGKLITFENEPADPNLPANSNRKVIVSEVITKPELIQRSNVLEEALRNQQYVDYCKGKIDNAVNEHDKKVWSCVAAYFGNNVTGDLLNLLGYNVETMSHKFSDYNSQKDVDDITEGVAKMDNVVNGNIMDGNAAFDAIAKQVQSRKSPSLANYKLDTTDDEEGLITQAILIGNIEAAVNLCFKNKRYADAIILSMAGGHELLAKTQRKYFAEHSGALNSLIDSVVSENWVEFVKECDVNCWKEVILGIFTHSNSDERSVLCDLLGDRLASSENPTLRKEARICYIYSGNVNKMIESSTDSSIQDLVELVVIMRKALEVQGIREVEIEGNIASVLSQYGEMLAAEGNLEAALDYLGNSQDPKIAMLKDRLCKALGYVPTGPQRPVAKTQNYYNQARKPQPQQQQQQQQQQLQQQQQIPPPLQPVQQNWNTAPMKQGTNALLSNQFNAQQSSYGSYDQYSYGQQQQQHQQQPPLPPVSQAPNVPLPPPPTSSSSVSGSRPSSVGPQSRSKYIIDPSVKSSSTYGNVQGTFPLQSQQMYNPSVPGYPIQSQPYPSSYPQQNPLAYAQEAEPTYKPLQPSVLTPNPTQVYDPIRSNPQGVAPQTYGNENPIYQPTSQPSGWNDPPIAKSSRNSQAKNEFQQQNPIFHPLRGAVPQQEINNPQIPYNQQPYGQNIPNQQQQYGQLPNQQPYGFQNQQFGQNMSNMGGGGGGGMQGFNKPLQPVEPLQPMAQPVETARIPEPEKPKAPIPEEHQHLKTVLDELRTQCHDSAKNPQMKKKIEDISRKLEILYDCLRESKLSQNTLQGLHQISQSIQSGDYQGGIGLHSQLVSGPDFSQIASFMPGIKVLLQSALQLGVYIR